MQLVDGMVLPQAAIPPRMRLKSMIQRLTRGLRKRQEPIKSSGRDKMATVNNYRTASTLSSSIIKNLVTSVNVFCYDKEIAV